MYQLDPKLDKVFFFFYISGSKVVNKGKKENKHTNHTKTNTYLFPTVENRQNKSGKFVGTVLLLQLLYIVAAHRFSRAPRTRHTTPGPAVN